jgi:hypothetical protein
LIENKNEAGGGKMRNIELTNICSCNQDNLGRKILVLYFWELLIEFSSKLYKNKKE